MEKQVNAMDVRYQQDLGGMQREVVGLQGCCDTINDLQTRITDTEGKISSASESFDDLLSRLNKELGRTVGTDTNGSRGGGSHGGSGKTGQGTGTQDGLESRLKDLEWLVNNTMQQTEQSCLHLENNLKDYFHREVSVFVDRFDDQAHRISDVEMEVDQVKERVSKVENNTSLMKWRLEECGCGQFEGEGRQGGERGNEGGSWGGRGTKGEESMGGTGGGLPGTTGQRENTTEKSLEWRVVANEDKIRHFNTQLKDLSVSGDSLYDKVRL